MVYRGKPSAGCGECRTRKVKCDQTRPACNRCIKAKRTCPGYRDQLSLLFRDESLAVAQKAKSNSSNSSSSNSPSQTTAGDSFQFVATLHDVGSKTPSTCWEIASRQDEVGLQLPLYPLKESERFQATCFFFSSYSWLYSGLMQGLDPHGELSPSAPMGEKAMINAIVSAGMASLSNLRGSQSMRLTACREYSKALKWTNAAISDRKQATEDTTLAAILCLSLFEILTCQTPESIGDFVEHTKGAVALLDLRGEKQLKQENALMLFYSFRNQIIAACIMRNLPVPAGLIELSEKATTLPNALTTSVVSHRLTILMAKLCDIRVIFEQIRPSVDAELLSKAFALDAELEAFTKEFPMYFTYDIVVIRPGQTFKISDSRQFPCIGNYRHSYTTWALANQWNNYRYSRILLNELILDQLKQMIIHPGTVPPSPDFKDLCCRICGVVRKLALDICEAVPSVMELGQIRNGHNRSLMDGLALLFPLYVAATVDGPGTPVCDWIRDCLTTIGVSMGIDQALTLVRMLEREPVLTRVLEYLQEQDDSPAQTPIDAEMPNDSSTYSTQYS